MKPILGWIAIGITVLFVAFNLDRARIWFFGIGVEMPLGLIVLASAAMGAAAAIGLSTLKRRKA